MPGGLGRVQTGPRATSSELCSIAVVFLGVFSCLYYGDYGTLDEIGIIHAWVQLSKLLSFCSRILSHSLT